MAFKKLKWSNEDLINEANVLACLNHENIVTYVGYYQSNSNDQYLVTEFCEHGSLEHFLSANQKTCLVSDKISV